MFNSNPLIFNSRYLVVGVVTLVFIIALVTLVFLSKETKTEAPVSVDEELAAKNEALQQPLTVGPAGTPDGIYRPFAPEDIPYLEEQKLKQ